MILVLGPENRSQKFGVKKRSHSKTALSTAENISHGHMS